jgi:ribonuclease HII
MLIAGVDEAGRGPLAGPVVCAAVILPDDDGLIGLDDSKRLNASTRDRLFDAIRSVALCHAVVSIDAATIDRMNILQATLHGMALALSQLRLRPELALIDGNRLPAELPCAARAVIAGDASERCIMAASVLAKVSRDRIMQAVHVEYPRYGFAVHKGYPTPAHLQALDAYGACPQHRRSFAPVRKVLAMQAVGGKSR